MKVKVFEIVKSGLAPLSEEIESIIQNWLDENKIKLPFQITKGLKNLPEAYLKLFEGGNIGKVVVEL